MEILNKEEVLEFWNSIIGDKKIEDIIEYVYGMNLEQLAEKYNDENDHHKKRVDQLLNIENKKMNQIKEIKLKNAKWRDIGDVLLYKYWDNIKSLEKYSDIVCDLKSMVEMLVDKIIADIFAIVYRAIILDLKYYKSMNLLKGETAEERAEFFEKEIIGSDKYLYEFFEGYPEAITAIDNVAYFAINALEELLDNTQKEIEQLNRVFFENNKACKIKSILLGEGDTHNEGRTVGIIEFDNGEKLVYKPRRLEIEDAYNRYIDWIDDQINDNKRIRYGKVYYNKTVGWMEFIMIKESTSEKCVKDYYYKIGKIMAILYTFNSNDMHSGNIIATEDSPVIIDLETILHPNYEKREKKTVFDVALEIYSTSVDRLALLPSYIVNPRTKEKMDIGGLSNDEEQLSPFESDAIVNFDTDEIKIEKKRSVVGTENNIPILNGIKVDVKNYIQDMEIGFRNMYRWIMENKEEYIHKVKQIFKNVPNRVLLRGTNEYAKILNLSYHPDLLVNRYDREIYLIRALKNGKVKNNDALKCELEQLLNTDIPYFYSYTDNNNLYYNDKMIVKDYYYESSIDIFEKKVENMSEIDMNRQISMIYNKFDKDYSFLSEDILIKEIKEINEEEIIKKIVTNIESRAIKTDNIDGITWFSKEVDPYGSSVTSNLTLDIFRGLTGILVTLFEKEKKYDKEIKMIIDSVDKINNIQDTEKLEDVKGIMDMVLLQNIGLIKEDLIQKSASVIQTFAQKLIEEKKYEDIVYLIGMLLTYCEKKVFNIPKQIQCIIDELVENLIEFIRITDRIEDNFTYFKGYYSMLYQLLRYLDINKDKKKEINLLCEEILEYERKNSIFVKMCESGKNDYQFIQMLYGKVLLYTKNVDKDKLLMEVKTGIEYLDNIIIKNNYRFKGGDAGNIVMLEYMCKMLNDIKLKSFYKNYRGTFINEFLEKELEKDGYFTIYETFTIENGLTGVLYALMYTNPNYDVPNLLTFE